MCMTFLDNGMRFPSFIVLIQYIFWGKCRKNGCEGTSVLAYGHYPLEIVVRPEHGPPRLAFGTRAHQSTTLKQILLQHNVSTYVAGHLHAAFGQRLHRVHRGGGETEGRSARRYCQQLVYSVIQSRTSSPQVVSNQELCMRRTSSMCKCKSRNSFELFRANHQHIFHQLKYPL